MKKDSSLNDGNRLTASFNGLSEECFHTFHETIRKLNNGPGRKPGSCEVQYQTDLKDLAKKKPKLTSDQAFDEMPKRFPKRYRIDKGPGGDTREDRLIKKEKGRDVARRARS